MSPKTIIEKRVQSFTKPVLSEILQPQRSPCATPKGSFKMAESRLFVGT